MATSIVQFRIDDELKTQATEIAVYSIPKIVSLLTPVFETYKVKKAVLFGSYAKGNAAKNSDVDILVDSGMQGMAFFGLVEDIITALDKEADVLDVSQIVPDSEVEHEINKTGVLIYGN